MPEHLIYWLSGLNCFWKWHWKWLWSKRKEGKRNWKIKEFKKLQNLVWKAYQIAHFYLNWKVYLKPYSNLIWFIFEWGFEIGKENRKWILYFSLPLPIIWPAWPCSPRGPLLAPCFSARPSRPLHRFAARSLLGRPAKPRSRAPSLLSLTSRLRHYPATDKPGAPIGVVPYLVSSSC